MRVKNEDEEVKHVSIPLHCHA